MFTVPLDRVRGMVKLLVKTAGGMASRAVTVTWTFFTLPFTSRTITSTVLGVLTSIQRKALGLVTMD